MKQEVFSNGRSKPKPSSSPMVARVNKPSTTSNTCSSSPGVKARPTTTNPTIAARRRLVRVTKDDKEKDEDDEKQRLRGEVDALKKEVERLHQLNTELEQQKRRLSHQLLAAQARIQHQHQHVTSDLLHLFFFRSALVLSNETKPTISGHLSDQSKQKEAANGQQCTAVSPLAPPNTKPPSPTPPPLPAPAGVPRPPPPPPSRQGPARINTVNKATALVELYNSLTKRDTKKSAAVNGDVAINPHHHNGIVGELQNRSTHLLAIKADVETKGEFINDLIKKVQTTSYTDMEQVLTFVDWLDQQLSTLSDETAVLKHFNWPERKADTLREAAFEYRDLKCVLTEVSSFNDDGTPTSCEATLRKISSLLDKLEKSMNRLMSLRNSTMSSYKEFRIPIDWMLDSGIASKMKLASVKFAKVCMKRVLQELDREMANEALVAQSVRFTYRAHQFAGGLDSEAMCTFEELRVRVRSQGRGSP